MSMPRTVEEILAHTDELAKRFENHDLGSGRGVEGRSLREVRRGFEAKGPSRAGPGRRRIGGTPRGAFVGRDRSDARDIP